MTGDLYGEREHGDEATFLKTSVAAACSFFRASRATLHSVCRPFIISVSSAMRASCNAYRIQKQFSRPQFHSAHNSLTCLSASSSLSILSLSSLSLSSSSSRALLSSEPYNILSYAHTTLATVCYELLIQL